jgi:tetratricopeptide (TPR) repeat protein
LDAATAVWSDHADEFQVLELMTRLADKSLVVIERLAGGTSRYWMLETFRQFAQEKLDESDEGNAARARHLKYFVAWPEEREAINHGAEGDWIAQMADEHENLLQALKVCARAEGNGEMALRLAVKVYPYWSLRGLYGVGREQLGAALRRPGAGSPTVERARALASMGDLARKQGALAEARACFEESLAIARNTGDSHTLLNALHGLGVVRNRENDPDAARECFNEALALAREIGESEGFGFGFVLDLASLASDQGDLTQGHTLAEEALAISRTLRSPWSVAVSLLELAQIALKTGALDEARCNLLEMLPIVRDRGFRSLAEPVLWRSSELAAAKDEAAWAARWSAAAAAIQSAMGSKRQLERERENHATIMVRVREKLGARQFAQAAAEGGALGYEEALIEAQAWLEDQAQRVHSI